MLFDKRSFAAVLLLGIAGGQAARAQVHDNAQLFQPQAVSRADERIEDMRKRFHKTLLLETFEEPPADRVKDINLNDSKMREELFEQWVKDRVAAEKVDGVYVLICMEPKAVRVAVNPDDTRAVFTKENQKRLRQMVIDRIQPDNPNQALFWRWANSVRQKRRNDDGLLDVVGYVGEKLRWNEPVDTSRFLEGLMIIAGVLCFWTLLVMVRARLRKWTPAESGVHIEDEGGRSIAVLGGGIGAVSGQWLVNSLFRRRRRPAPSLTGNVPAEAANNPDNLPEEP